MSTTIRLQELHVLNNNIVGECNKMTQYLKMIKERSAHAITYIDSQNIPNILRRYSSTYEYLNRLYIKILDQNCAFELFFMELNDVIPIDSAQSSAKCSTAESTYLGSTARRFTESNQTLDSILYQNVLASIPKGTVNSIDATSSNSSDIPRTKTVQKSTKTKNMNVDASEFEPLSSSTNSSVCSISSKSDILEKSTITVVQTETPSSANKEINRKNVALQHVPSHFHANIKNINNEKPIQKTTPDFKKDQCAFTSKAETAKNDQDELDVLRNQVRNEKCLTGATIRNIKSINNVKLAIQKISPDFKEDQCATTSKAKTVENDQYELDALRTHGQNDKCVTGATIRNNKSINNEKLPIPKTTPKIKEDQCASTSKAATSAATVENDEDALDELSNQVRHDEITGATIRNIIKKIDERTREYELKTSVRIPDLRPKVVRNESGSSNSLTVYGHKRISTQTKNDKHENIPQKRIHTPNEKHLMEQQIELKKGPTPKEGDLCFVSCVESLSLFYIQVIRDENTLIDCLSEQIAELCNSLKSFSNKKQAAKYINEYCVCYIPNYSWCRVQITNWIMDHEQLLEVRLIDYGMTCKVPINNIRAVNEYFFELPVMADRCELAWVKPLGNSSIWSTETITHFNKLLESSDRLFTISYVEEEEDHLIIDLQNNEINSVAGLMINDGKAALDDESDDGKQWTNEFMRKQIMRAQGFNVLELNQTEEDKLESLMYDDEDDEEVSNPNLAVAHYNARDEKEICRIFLSRGYCFKGNNCTFSHSPLNPDGWTTDREAVFYDAFNTLQLPKSGDEIKVKVVHLIDLKKFYVTIKDLPECTNLISMPINNIKALCKLLNDPNEVKTYKKMVVIPAIGEIILVNNDDIWERARVLEIEEFANKVEIEVLMVDCGKKRKFNMKQCRKIEEKHLYLPFQAVLCSLCNVVLKDKLPERANDLGIDYLEMNILNKKLTAKVVYASHYLNVHLFLENGQDVGEELIKAEIVDRCTTTFAAISGREIFLD